VAAQGIVSSTFADGLYVWLMFDFTVTSEIVKG
jgi:hypothetical protein